jgi:hypothetical protein
LAKAQKLAETAVTLKNEFLKTANWRREQAIEYPDDKWNFEAVAARARSPIGHEKGLPALEACGGWSPIWGMER